MIRNEKETIDTDSKRIIKKYYEHHIELYVNKSNNSNKNKYAITKIDCISIQANKWS